MIHKHVRRLAEWRSRISVVRQSYFAAHGRWPRLFRPVLFSEKMQWRKLFDMRPEFTILSDKLAVREFVAERDLRHLLIPLLWQGEQPQDIPVDTLPFPLILKSSHAAGHVHIGRERADMLPEIIEPKVQSWLTCDWGNLTTEPGYLAVPRRLIIETLLEGEHGAQPVEYKIFVFAGRAQILQMYVGRNETRRSSFYRRSGERLDWITNPPPIAPPMPVSSKLNSLIDVAERLGAGFDHVRVDLYEREDEIFVGEITVYSWSGLSGPYPGASDFEMGSFWVLRAPLLKALRTILFSRWGTPSA